MTQTHHDIATVFHEVAGLLIDPPALEAALGAALEPLRRLFPDCALALYRYAPHASDPRLLAVRPEALAALLGDPSTAAGALLAPEGCSDSQGMGVAKAAPIADGGRALLCAPILGRGVVWGALVAAAPQPHTFEAGDLGTLRAAASIIALGVENARRAEALEAGAAWQAKAERVAAMSDMAAHIAHRLVNDMSAIRLTAAVLMRQREKSRLTDAELVDRLGDIDRHAGEAIALVRRVKRPFDAVEALPLHVEYVLDEVIKALQPPTDVTLAHHCEPDLPPVRATRQLAEVFHHLIRNALEAMQRAPRKHLTITAARAGEGWVEVSVQDSGPGVPDAVRAALFSLGVTSKPEGAGYGLWWSRLYLARLGGALELDAQVREGARFIVRLPAAPRPGSGREASG